MKTTDAPCRIEGVALTRVELVLGGAGDMSMKVKANLVSKEGDVHSNCERVGGWSPKVIQTLSDFANALESHLLAVHFDVGEEDDRSAESDAPTGILGSRLERS